jgi:hypothetical protein
MISEIKYWIADKLFAKELDDAYFMGIREGARMTKAEMSYRLDLKENVYSLTKTQKIGYAKAKEIIATSSETIQKASQSWR